MFPSQLQISKNIQLTVKLKGESDHTDSLRKQTNEKQFHWLISRLSEFPISYSSIFINCAPSVTAQRKLHLSSLPYMLTGLTLALIQWQPKLILAYTWVNTCSNECYHVNHHFFPLLIMKCAKNTNSWGHCPIIFVCWLVFLAKGVIKWFWELSDTCQEVTKDHKQEGAECASCRPMVAYRGRFLVPSWLIHQHTHTCIR